MLPFRKYHGLGNDFVVVSGQDLSGRLSPAAAIRLCDRHRGVGADGVLTVWPDDEADGRMQVHNADGSESAMCGNGIRCVARYLLDTGAVPADAPTVRVRAGAGIYPCRVVGDDRFAVAMGRPRTDDPSLPSPSLGEDQLRVEVGGRLFTGTRLSLGNPHFVVLGHDPPRELAERFGAGISAHPLFPNRTNVAFARVQPGDSIEAVVYERGVGITQACGSGACAVAAAAVRRATWARDTPAPVRLPGGVLTITVGADDALTMEGEAVFVFAGALELDRFGVPDPGRPDPGAEP